jgi:hypothetical protein
LLDIHIYFFFYFELETQKTMKYIYFITLLILASATLGSAQFGGNLSDGCKNQLTKMLGDQEINKCFPFGSVAPLASSSSIPDQNTLKTAADAICSAPKCSDDLVSKTLNEVKTSCQEDIKNKVPLAQLVNVALSLYSPTRDSMCFKNSTDGYCFIESKAAVEQILQSAPKGQDPAITFAGAPKDEVCTPCNKAIFNTYLNYQSTNPNAFSDIQQVTEKDINNAKNAISGKCGKDFLGNY